LNIKYVSAIKRYGGNLRVEYRPHRQGGLREIGVLGVIRRGAQREINALGGLDALFTNAEIVTCVVMYHKLDSHTSLVCAADAECEKVHTIHGKQKNCHE